MKKFRYPLERLKQFRELELNSAADDLRLISTEVQKVKARISEINASILESQRSLMTAEKKTGTIHHDLRKLTSVYVNSAQTDQKDLEEKLKDMEHQQEKLHAHLLEKKQSVRILENHEERLGTMHQLEEQSQHQKEDDELWLSRSQHDMIGKSV
jgi:flagellar export protein FliJ